MPQINILNILQGDNQSTIVDKINYNFDQILSSGGGPQGAKGLIGPTGPVGPQGYQGPQGIQGASGSKWFVQETTPASGGITGSNPWEYPTLGDYWMDPDSANQEIYIYTATGWVDTGYGLAAGELFQKITPINIQGSATGQAILIAGTTASDKSIVFSDSTTSEYTPGGNAIDNLNYENSKLKIATKDSRTKLISFGRSDYDITPGGSGYSSSNFNPYFSWNESVNTFAGTGVSPGFYNISFTNPKGSISINASGAPSESGINMSSNSEISSVASDYILLKTNKSTFVSAPVLSSGGSFEFSTQSGSSPSNQAFAPVFANSAGVGLGLGTGQFKQSGNDSRRLAVNGNLSIGTGTSPHTNDIFIGHSTSGNYNKGALFVLGQGAFGATGPTIAYTSGTSPTTYTATGGAESLNRFPQSWVTSKDPGPVLQIRSLGTKSSKGFIGLPRTVIGDGSTEYGFETASIYNRVSGQYADISQIAEFQGDLTEKNASGPIFSYQHKIRASGVTSSEEPIFAVTSHVNSGAYNKLTVGKSTKIQTLNSNPVLEIFANSTGNSDNNSVRIGTNDNSLIKIRGGVTPSATGYGTTTVGISGDYYTGLRTNLSTMSEFIDANSAFPGESPKPNHSLVVTGIQTIGTSDSVSRFNPGEKDDNSLFGANSMLKIHRNLFTSVTTTAFGTSVTGAYINNYPNGLEITSYKSNVDGYGSVVNVNRSVAIAVGASSMVNVLNSAGDNLIPSPFNTTGFFVSDTGENVAIGQYIDYNTALAIDSAGTDFAIRAIGNVGITGDVSVTGTFRSSSSATIGGLLSVNSGGINATGGFNFYGGDVNIYANGLGKALRIYSTSYSTPDFIFSSAGEIDNLTDTLTYDDYWVWADPGRGTKVIKSGRLWGRWTGFSTYYVKETNSSLATSKLNWTRIGSTVHVSGMITLGTSYFNLPVVTYDSPTQPGYAGAPAVTVKGIVINTTNNTVGRVYATPSSSSNPNHHVCSFSSGNNIALNSGTIYVSFSYQLYN